MIRAPPLLNDPAKRMVEFQLKTAPNDDFSRFMSQVHKMRHFHDDFMTFP
jgi:hypothetical protein